jgi:hypothetical protein
VIDKTKLPKGYYGYRKSTDDFLVPLRALPKIFLTEIFAALEKIKPAQ